MRLRITTKILVGLLLTCLASFTVNANLASGVQKLGSGLHQGEAVLNLLMHQGITTSSTTSTTGSSVVAKGGDNATGFLGSKRLQLKNAPFQKVRNTPTTINGRDFSGHALDQMQNRGFTPSVVENAINTGTRSAGNTSSTSVFTDAVNKLRVITNSETGRVVTVIPGVK